MYFSTPCSQSLSIYVLTLVWQTKFHMHVEQQVDIYWTACKNYSKLVRSSFKCEHRFDLLPLFPNAWNWMGNTVQEFNSYFPVKDLSCCLKNIICTWFSLHLPSEQLLYWALSKRTCTFFVIFSFSPIK